MRVFNPVRSERLRRAAMTAGTVVTYWGVLIDDFTMVTAGTMIALPAIAAQLSKLTKGGAL